MIKYTCGAGTPEEAETNCTYFIRGECTSSFCEYRRKKQTNADRIRSTTDEELIEFICSNSQCKFCKFERWGRCELLEWLQQPVKEEQ